MNDRRMSSICRPTCRAIAVGGTTLRDNNLCRPTQPGQPRYPAVNATKYAKMSHFYKVVFTLWMFYCRLLPPVLATWELRSMEISRQTETDQSVMRLLNQQISV